MPINEGNGQIPTDAEVSIQLAKALANNQPTTNIRESMTTPHGIDNLHPNEEILKQISTATSNYTGGISPHMLTPNGLPIPQTFGPNQTYAAVTNINQQGTGRLRVLATTPLAGPLMVPSPMPINETTTVANNQVLTTPTQKLRIVQAVQSTPPAVPSVFSKQNNMNKKKDQWKTKGNAVPGMEF